MKGKRWSLDDTPMKAMNDWERLTMIPCSFLFVIMYVSQRYYKLTWVRMS
jgi:hypothetical protein